MRRLADEPPDDPLLPPFGGCYNVMGDNAMILMPTPGHTPGSLSMLVRSDGLPPLLLVADLAYDIKLLMKDQVPGTGDADTLRSTYTKVRALKEQLPDLVILGAHDPASAGALASSGWPAGKSS